DGAGQLVGVAVVVFAGVGEVRADLFPVTESAAVPEFPGGGVDEDDGPADAGGVEPGGRVVEDHEVAAGGDVFELFDGFDAHGLVVGCEPGERAGVGGADDGEVVAARQPGERGFPPAPRGR